MIDILELDRPKAAEFAGASTPPDSPIIPGSASA
jgi:hypothetical protein